MLEVRLFGELRLAVDGVDIAPPESRPARLLLARLALEPGLHPRATVAAALWPDVLDASARAALRQALWRLRSALGSQGAQALLSTRSGVGLRPDAVWVDVAAFREHAEGGRDDEASMLWDGPLLEGLDDDWVVEERAAIGEAVSMVLERLAQRAERSGDQRLALELTRRRLAADPLAEEPHRDLMRRLAAGGDGGAALAAYRRLERRLRSELGASPSPETVRLARELRREQGDALPGHASIALPAALTTHRRSPFVGRVTELRRLSDAWERAIGGERRMALIEGEAGIGKTRLVSEFALRAYADGGVVLYGRCDETDASGFRAVREALDPYMRRCSAGAQEALVAAAGPDLRRLFTRLDGATASTGLSSPADPAQARLRLFETLDALLAAIAAQAPLLVVVEDLHWADRATLLLLAHLAAHEDPASLLIVGTLRPAGLGTASPLAALRTSPRAQQLTLVGLGESQVEELLLAAEDRWLPDMLRGVAAAKSLHAHTGGNPLFVEEYVRLLAEDPGAAPGPAARTLEGMPVPAAVRSVITQRLERLDAPTRAVLAAAAVAGEEFEVDVVAEAVDGGGSVTSRAVEVGLRARALVSPGYGQRRFAFSHALVRSALYEALAEDERAGLHARVAEAIERLHGDELDTHLAALAEHWSRARDAERTVRYARQAAEHAMAALAYEQAAASFARVLEALEQTGADSQEHLSMLIRLADAHVRAGDLEAGRAAARRAADLARAQGDVQALAQAALTHAGADAWITPDVQSTVIALLDEALAAVGDRDPRLRARLLARLALEKGRAGRWPATEAREIALEALALARRSGDDEILARGLTTLHDVSLHCSHLDERLRLGAEALAWAERRGDEQGRLDALNGLAFDQLARGDAYAARATTERHRVLAEELRDPYHRAQARLFAASLDILAARFGAADATVDDVLAHGGAISPALPGRALASRFGLRYAQGRVGEAAGTLERLISEWPAVAVLRAAWAFVALERHDRTAAAELIELITADDFAFAAGDVAWLGCACLAGELCALVGDSEHAAAVLREIEPYADQFIVTGWHGLCAGPVERPLGVTAAALGRTAEAEAHLRKAIRLAREAGSPTWAAWAQADLAELLRDSGQTAAARAEAEAALHTARELGLGSVAERAAAVLAGRP